MDNENPEKNVHEFWKGGKQVLSIELRLKKFQHGVLSILNGTRDLGAKVSML